ncbi:MAG: tetratricopeptide repeat protein [Spirochaetota bacterium]
MNKKYLTLGLITATSLCLSFPCVVHSQSLFADTIATGIQSGYSLPIGYYADSLSNSIAAGVVSYIPMNSYSMFNIQLLYAKYALAHSSHSTMQTFGIYVLPSLYYMLPFSFIVYASSGPSFQHFTLSAIKTNITDSTQKVGFSAAGGIGKTFFPRTLIVFDTMYSLSELSHKKFQTVSFSIKACYQFAMHDPSYYAKKEKLLRTNEQIAHLFSLGVEYLKKKDANRALTFFTQVLSLDPYHKDSQNYVTAISYAIQQYDTAKHLLKANNDLEALPLLVTASQYIQNAQKDLKLLQAKHNSHIPQLLEKGVQAFNNKQYDECIATMNVVLILHSDNEIAKAYTVRARRIKETLSRLH